MNIPAILALSIPIVAIVGHYYLKLKEMESKSKGFSQKDEDTLKKIIAENQELKERITNLEEIVTSLDKDLISLSNTTLKNKLHKE